MALILDPTMTRLPSSWEILQELRHAGAEPAVYRQPEQRVSSEHRDTKESIRRYAGGFKTWADRVRQEAGV